MQHSVLVERHPRKVEEKELIQEVINVRKEQIAEDPHARNFLR